MKNRDEIYSIFLQFHARVNNVYGSTISTFRTDNAREFLSISLTTFLSTHGIVHQTSCPYTPQQNGVAERKIRHLTETARTLLHHMHVPPMFWSHAILTSIYLINRLPSTVLRGAIPWRLLHPTTLPFPLPARVFGCVCYVHLHGPSRDKLTWAQGCPGYFSWLCIEPKGLCLLCAFCPPLSCFC